MSVIAVLADPPVPGFVLPALAETAPLRDDETAALYRAMLTDTLAAATQSGADVLVNYRPDDQVPGGDSEAQIRDVAGDALDDARFEPQVGTTKAGRVGNTVTHLLRDEDEGMVAVADGTAPLARTDIDEGMLRLRSNDVVLTPSLDGRVALAAFTEPIEFTDAYATPAIETMTRRAVDQDFAVDYMKPVPTVETGRDLATALPIWRSRAIAGRLYPERTLTVLDDVGLSVTDVDGVATLERP